MSDAQEMRKITHHHDGHGLAEDITIYADEPGAGGASHRYTVVMPERYVEGVGLGQKVVAEITYQHGPRFEEGSKDGVLDTVLLAIVADRMEQFNAGPYRCRENSLVLTKVQEALHWLKHRADERAKRGVLGTTRK